MSVDFTSEQRELQNRARRFSREHIRPRSMEYLERGEYPWEVFERAAEQGFIGMWFDPEYGGRGSSFVEQCIVDEEFARGDSNLGLALHSSIVGCYVVAEYGTHEQKQTWMTPVTEGRGTTSLGLTEPETGSAMSRISTRAERDGDHYVINGRKRWVGNGSKSDWVATLCRTNPDTVKPHRGLSLIVVPGDADGFKRTPIEKMGLNANDHADLVYDDVRVPRSHLLGREEGRGFYQVLRWLNQGHGRIAVSAVCLGSAQGALDRALQYVQERRQGGSYIGDYQGVRWKLADMKTKIEVARSQLYRSARVIDAVNRGEQVPERAIEQASITKLYTTEMASEVTSEAIQIFGGNGYAREYEVEHIHRDVQAGTLYEGTSEILRNTLGKTLLGEL